MSEADAIPIACEPVPSCPNKVKLLWPKDIEPAPGSNGHFNRVHLSWTPGQGFNNCGEYSFYWHTVQHYIYGVCQTCGEVYVKCQWSARHNAAMRATRGAL